MTHLVHTCFSGQIGSWCQVHGVEYIGHIIEDDNAHARMGCSIGHYFREMEGQHMAGIDVVHHQIVPIYTTGSSMDCRETATANFSISDWPN